jgi:phosphate:Na+ symporter
MFISRMLNKTVMLWLCGVVFISNFLFSDILLTCTGSFSGTASVANQRTISMAAPQGTQQHVTWGSMAQAQAASASTKTSQEDIDLFRIMMGALAGLVLFIYGLTRCTWPHDMRHIWELVVPHLPFRFIDF